VARTRVFFRLEQLIATQFFHLYAKFGAEQLKVLAIDFVREESPVLWQRPVQKHSALRENSTEAAFHAASFTVAIRWPSGPTNP
jgi:hypothetical protein